jgi:regulator of replication initiation timing
MANEKNNINELVTDVDDPTAELEISVFAQDEFDAEADAIRQQVHDLIEKNTDAEREIASLSNRLSEATEQNAQMSKQISSAALEVNELQSSLNAIQKQHEEEIRTLRFELGSAQSTIVDAEEMKSQLASDLIDAQSFKVELEQTLGDAEEQASERVEQLEKEVTKLTRQADNFEQKLSAKSEANSVLLAELTKESERIDLVGETEDVIQDVDVRLTERRLSGGRVARVLIGTVDDQVLRFPLFKNRLTIGRTKDNDIQLKTVFVSRRHAVIQTDGDATRIVDQGSRNGVQVNSESVSEHILCHGDTVEIGDARFRFEAHRKRGSQ